MRTKKNSDDTNFILKGFFDFFVNDFVIDCASENIFECVYICSKKLIIYSSTTGAFCFFGFEPSSPSTSLPIPSFNNFH